jgi:molybdenum cofactor cytidylyltransferase
VLDLLRVHEEGKMVEVSAILLGAGESKRMGVDKLSLPWGRKTVLEHCLKTLLQSKVKEVIIVLNDRMKWVVDHAKDQKVYPERRFFNPSLKVGFGDAERVKVVSNPYYKRGMSTSVRRGLHAIDASSQGILIALGDQPLIKTRTINALIHAFVQKKGTIVVPSFRGKQGHPVIFHCRYLKELSKLKGDIGGRSIIEKHPEEVRLVRVKSEGVTKDMDTWEDYNPPDPIPSPLSADRQAQVGKEKRRGKK